MLIRHLNQFELDKIVECLILAFDGYFVKMPSELDYWKEKFYLARVDYSLSFGAFDGDKLVAFIMNGIDYHNEVLSAFNTGTSIS